MEMFVIFLATCIVLVTIALLVACTVLCVYAICMGSMVAVKYIRAQYNSAVYNIEN